MKAKDVMTTRVVTVSPDHSVRHAARIMLDNHVSGLPVMDDDNHLVGLITEGDLLRRSELGLQALARSEQPVLTREEEARNYVKSHAWKVADVMSGSPVVVEEEVSLGQIAALLQERDIKRVPVVRNGALVGIVSRADLLHAVAMAKLDETAPGDEAIRRAILTRLNENASLDGTNLTVTVTNGIIHLWGYIDTKAGRDVARVLAERVRGVKGVVEHFSQPVSEKTAVGQAR